MSRVIGPIEVIDNEKVLEAIANVRSDSHDDVWLALCYSEEKKNALELFDTGKDFESLKELFTPDKLYWTYFRTITGDQESRRTKFVVIAWAGEAAPVMKRARMSQHKFSVEEVLSPKHVDIHASSPEEVTMEIILDLLKKAGGADYDLGSNRSGYTSSPTKATALKAFDKDAVSGEDTARKTGGETDLYDSQYDYDYDTYDPYDDDDADE